MKILFICGCLEPGRDGVGDYVRCLSAELIKHGHQAFALALNDHFVSEKSTGVQKIYDRELTFLRMPDFRSARLELLYVDKWIQTISPDLLSLQFVPFAFHKKGFRFGLANYLKRLTHNSRWHVMFHELWMGRRDKMSLKYMLLSYLQELQIKKIISFLNPVVIHTHLPIYLLRLAKIRRGIRPLPLFSNISVSNIMIQKKEENVFRIGFFSQVSCSEAIVEFINQFCEQILKINAKPELILIGGRENNIIKYKNLINALCPKLEKITHTGYIEEEDISGALHSCNLGLTPVPLHALGKSGSVAAFLAHKVPVAAPVSHAENGNSNIGFFNLESLKSILINPALEDFNKAKEHVSNAAQSIDITEITQKFLTDLKLN